MIPPGRGDEQTESACLIHAGAIGDFILSLRVVASLRAHLRRGPKRVRAVKIEVLGHAATASLAVGRGGVDAVTSLEHVRLHTMFAGDGPVDPSCITYFARFGIVVNMLAADDEVFTRRLCEIAGTGVITVDTAPRSQTRHVTEGWLDDLRAVGIAASPAPPTLMFADDERRRGRQLLCNAAGGDGRPVVLLHPGSGGRAKCWPLEQFVRLARALRDAGVQPAFMLGPVELEQHPPGIVDRLSASAPVLVEPDLVHAAAVIAAADAYVGNDAGMTHLAAATGTPTVAIFGPTDPVVWRPLGDHVTVVCGERPTTFDGVSVERVRSAVLEPLRT